MKAQAVSRIRPMPAIPYIHPSATSATAMPCSYALYSGGAFFSWRLSRVAKSQLRTEINWPIQWKRKPTMRINAPVRMLAYGNNGFILLFVLYLFLYLPRLHKPPPNRAADQRWTETRACSRYRPTAASAGWPGAKRRDNQRMVRRGPVGAGA